LAAARQLHGAGATVIVLEARDRIGGRILTRHVDTNELPLELGAEFVHGQPPAIFQLIESAGLRATETSGRRLLSESGVLRPFDDFWDIVDNINAQIDPRADVSYQHFLESVDAPPHHKRMAKSYVEGFNAARAELISAASIATAERAAERIHGERQFRLPFGYDNIIRELARPLPENRVRLEHVVREVKWRRRHAEVRCTCGEDEIRLSSRQLITTLPLALMRRPPDEPGGIYFDPPLTAKAEALARLEIGQVMKVIMCFRERFWESSQSAGGNTPVGLVFSFDATFPILWTVEPLRENIVVAWAAGSAGERLIGLAPAEIRSATIKSVSATFGIPDRQVEAQLIAIYFHDWSADPFARGAYSYPGVGDLKAPQKLAEPLDETLFFAGEATDFQGANGTVHGAIESGYRAAHELLRET
jgi:monoamine oxidase